MEDVCTVLCGKTSKFFKKVVFEYLDEHVFFGPFL